MTGRRWTGALVLAACALARPAVARQGDTVLVMPFELDRFDGRVAWVAEGAAIGVATALAQRETQTVSRDERLAAFERLQLPSSAPLTRATIIKVAELVGATKVVLGRAEVSGTTVTLDVRVLDVASAELGASAKYVTPWGDLLDACDRAARQVAPANGPGRAGTGPPPMPAFESYVRGLVARNPDAGQRYLAQAIELAPEYAAARMAQWELLTDRGEHEAALAVVRGVRAEGPAGFDARVRAAASLVRLRRYDEAFAALKSLESPTEAAVVANMLGVVQLRRAWTPQTGRPAYYFTRAAELDPTSADYAFNLGYAYWVDRDAMAAAYWLREAVRRAPSDADAHLVLGAALAASGAAAEGDREKELARRLSARWESAGASEEVPRGLERLVDRVDPARSRVDAALSAGAERDQRELAAFHVDTARRAFEAGRDPEAIRELKRALYLTPYDGGAHLLLGRALARSGLLGEAASAFKMAVWIQETPEALIALGDALLRQRDVAGARRAADRAFLLAPQSPDVAAFQARVRAAGPGGA